MLSRLALLIACLSIVSCQKESQVERATRDGILLIGNSGEPKSFDPQNVTGVLESNINRALFEGIVRFHPTEDLASPGGVAMELTPDEAATVWTVKLRPGLKWSDGEPLTAEDFAFSYERILTPELGAKYSEMLYFMKGAEAFNKGETDSFSDVGFELVDSQTFKITLRGPTPYFPELLKHYTWYPVPKHSVLKYGTIGERGNAWSKPKNLVSNGPFRLKSYRLNDHIEVERNPYYWDKDNVGIDGVRFLPITNTFTEARMFRDGQLHITYSAAPEVVDLMEKKAPETLRKEPYLGSVLYRFNVTRKPLDDKLVRQALSLSIDREQLCKTVFRGYTPAYGVTPPMSDYDPPKVAMFAPGKARELLAEAGFPDGKGFPRLKLLIASRETATTLATAIQAMWREHLGVEIEIENKEWTGYLESMSKLEYDIAAGGWIGDYIDPLSFLEMWTPGNGNNRTGWASQPFADKLAESFASAEATERFGLLKEAEAILLDEAPVTPIAWMGKNYLISPVVKGWEPLLLDNHPFTSLSLDSEESSR